MAEKGEKLVKVYKTPASPDCHLCGRTPSEVYVVMLGEEQAQLVCEKCKDCLKMLAELGVLKLQTKE